MGYRVSAFWTCYSHFGTREKDSNIVLIIQKKLGLVLFCKLFRQDYRSRRSALRRSCRLNGHEGGKDETVVESFLKHMLSSKNLVKKVLDMRGLK